MIDAEDRINDGIEMAVTEGVGLVSTPSPSPYQKYDELERFLAGAVLVALGALLVAAGRSAGLLGGSVAAARGLELMGVLPPRGSSAGDATEYLSSAARAIMARWPT